MITTANYLLKATVGKQEYFFEYDAPDIWSALRDFWHEDYPETLIDVDGGEKFPIDVCVLEHGKTILAHTLMLNSAMFHAFYDEGHTASGVYTLNSFNDDIRRKDKEKNDTTSFFYYMWNRWSEDECKIAFADGDYNHFWTKWCQAYEEMGGPRGAAELFYMGLSNTNRDKLMKRARQCYDGMTEKG